MQIRYRSGYKYQTVSDNVTRLPFAPPATIDTPFIRFDTDGLLTIRAGYAWDGASGAIDTKTIMRGSLVHDALYQLMRENRIDHDLFRSLADWAIKTICLEDGMIGVRAWWVYRGVRWGGHPSADPRYERPILTAP